MPTIFKFNEYILFESKGFSQNIKILSDYIFDVLYDYALGDGKGDENDITDLYNDYIDSRDYDDENLDIQIDFDKVKGFDKNLYNLATYKRTGSDDLWFGNEDYDMIVSLDRDSRGSNCGSMDSSEPILYLNPKFFKTMKTLNKNKIQIKNTIMHELTHYVQSMSNIGNGDPRGVTARDTNPTYSFQVATQKVRKYYDVNQMTYILDKSEMQARIAGFAQTMYGVIDDMYSKYLKKHKNFNYQEFRDFVLNHKSFNKYDLHIQFIEEFIDEIKQDNWDNFIACKNDTENPYRTDSIIYVMLRLFENRPLRSTLPLPGKSKDKLVDGLQTKSVFDNYREKLAKYAKSDFESYKKKVLNVIDTICNEKGYDK